MADQLEAQQEEQRGTEERLIGRSDMERFMLRSPVEIAGVLRNLARTAQWVTVYFGADDFYATTLVHVDRDKDMVVFERSPDERVDARLQQIGRASGRERA